mmetsp:Transcript_11761/g.35851  ORF Transcript_11761/g.35851 Transcript_11761/m.35851 type:complete len:935 (-) Transcript_11761:9-2813(-)
MGRTWRSAWLALVIVAFLTVGTEGVEQTRTEEAAYESTYDEEMPYDEDTPYEEYYRAYDEDANYEAKVEQIDRAARLAEESAHQRRDTAERAKPDQEASTESSEGGKLTLESASADSHGKEGFETSTEAGQEAASLPRHLHSSDEKAPFGIGMNIEPSTVGEDGSPTLPIIKIIIHLHKDRIERPLQKDDFEIAVNDLVEERVSVQSNGYLIVTVDSDLATEEEKWTSSHMTLSYKGERLGTVEFGKIPLALQVLGFTKSSEPLLEKKRNDRLPEEIEWENVQEEMQKLADEPLSEKEILQWELIDEVQKLANGTHPESALKRFDDMAEAGDDLAQATLGAIYLSGYGTLRQRNDKKALDALSKSAAQGNPEAQNLLGFLHASGWISELGQDPARSVLYWTFASRAGSPYAQMAMGYRYMYGIDVEKNCDKSSLMYLRAAERIVEEITEQKVVTPYDSVRLDHMPSVRRKSEQVELVQYTRHNADHGDITSQRKMGQLYLFGARGVKQNFEKAHEMFSRAAEAGDPRAHAFLGLMYFRAIGVAQDNASAWDHFYQSSLSDDPAGLQGVGIAYRYGVGVEEDHVKAVEHFKLAADRGHSEGMYSLGTMYLKGLGVQKSTEDALAYFVRAAELHHVQAMYQVGLMVRGGYPGVPKNCALATALLKAAAENWLGGSFLSEAFNLYDENDFTGALYRYSQAAQLGVEVAQFNAAYMLERRRGSEGRYTGGEDLQALEMYKLSAQQGYVQSALRVGDIYYNTFKDYDSAASIYYKAKEMRSAEAMFNLGTMHVFGKGLPADLHLAKRYFDHAKADAEDSDDARLPALLALLALRLYAYWKTYIDTAIDYFGAAWAKVNGEEVVWPQRPAEQGLAAELAEEESNETTTTMMLITEYTDLIILVLLLCTLMVVVVARRRRLGAGENPRGTVIPPPPRAAVE